MRYLPLVASLALVILSTGCLASLPVKVAAAEPGSHPVKVKELPGGVTLITDADWDKEVIQASNDFPVVVDMYADWCGPCKRLSPILDEISMENHKVKFVKINSDQSSHDDALGVNAIPAVFVFKNGVVATKFVGLKSKEELVGIFSNL